MRDLIVRPDLILEVTYYEILTIDVKLEGNFASKIKHGNLRRLFYVAYKEDILPHQEIERLSKESYWDAFPEEFEYFYSIFKLCQGVQRFVPAAEGIIPWELFGKIVYGNVLHQLNNPKDNPRKSEIYNSMRDDFNNFNSLSNGIPPVCECKEKKALRDLWTWSIDFAKYRPYETCEIAEKRTKFTEEYFNPIKNAYKKWNRTYQKNNRLPKGFYLMGYDSKGEFYQENNRIFRAPQKFKLHNRGRKSKSLG